MNLVGRILGGCQLLQVVGRGGMGEVYRAQQLSLDREVAVKVLAAHFAQNEEFRQRFLREARSIAKVNHPNILQIYEVGESDGIYFMVMEFIRGSSLAERLQRRGFIEWREASDCVRQAAAGLASAAKRGIIHRDVKPDNLMRTEEGLIKVSDFGLAKECQGAELTHTDAVMGTPAYMSPEQCDGAADIDTRADIYSLGGSFYRIVTGVLPFDAPTPVAMMYKHKHEELVPPERYMPSIPAALSEVIRTMMAKDRENRYQTMEEAASAVAVAVAEAPAEAGEMTLRVSAPGGDFGFDTPAPPSRGSTSVLQSGAPVAARDAEADALAEEGDRLMAAGRPVAAYACWRKALEHRPGDAALREKVTKAKEESTVASVRIAQALLARGKFDQLRRELQQKLKIDPDNIDAMEELQALDFMDGRKRTATNEIRQLLSTSRYPEALAVWQALPEVLRDKTLEEMMRRVETQTLPVLRLAEEARELTRQGQLQEAMEVWDRALTIDESNDQVRQGRQETARHLHRLETLMRDAYQSEVQARPAHAIQCYEEVLRAAPSFPHAREKLVRCRVELATAADTHGSVEEALALWQQALEEEPGHLKAQKRVQELEQRRTEIKARSDQARQSMRGGRYSAAIRHWRRVVQLEPSSASARHSLAAARKNRLLRHRLPAAAVLLLLAAGGLYFLKLQSETYLESAQRSYAGGAYEEAVRAWEAALEVPVWSLGYREEVAGRILRAGVMRAKEAADRAFAAGDAAAHAEKRAALHRALATHGELFEPKERDRLLLEADLQAARLLFDRGQDEEARTAYSEARAFAAARELRLPTQDLDRAEGLAAFHAGTEAEARKHITEAMQCYRKAVAHLPEYRPARQRLTALEQGARKVEDLVQEASRRLAFGIHARPFDEAKAHWEAAKAAAKKAIAADPGNLTAKRVQAEAEWRIDAGAGMVFFKTGSDSALAIDRYEYPNREGESPKAVSYFEARRLAEAEGKRLPTAEQWLYVAEGPPGQPLRLYPWGDEFDATRCVSSVLRERFGPEPSGRTPGSTTPEGVADLAGNLAEWVDGGESEFAETAYAYGGHFAITAAQDLLCAARQKHPAKIANKYVGFRCVKIYRRTEE